MAKSRKKQIEEELKELGFDEAEAAYFSTEEKQPDEVKRILETKRKVKNRFCVIVDDFMYSQTHVEECVTKKYCDVMLEGYIKNKRSEFGYTFTVCQILSVHK